MKLDHHNPVTVADMLQDDDGAVVYEIFTTLIDLKKRGEHIRLTEDDWVGMWAFCSIEDDGWGLWKLVEKLTPQVKGMRDYLVS